MKKRIFKSGSILLLLLVALVLIPQTRRPIKRAINTVRVKLFLPPINSVNVGDELTPFTYQLTNLEGDLNPIDIGKGRVTFISYWATWCPPCIVELPSIQELYNDYGAKIDFVLITKEKPEVVERFLKKKQLNLPVVFPNMETPESLLERSIPTNYLIDQTGKVVMKEKGEGDWSRTLVRETLDSLLLK
ncbi:TlpA family protein disulfide reductase [Maribacter aestuarii]|uniref:TlpA family protein disulfide reductase n=1 Tax=Maribacter aestuarii TaxID=1130723 RepID=UPI00248B4670|nr:TlpA disulfide reductase family protein [Maribacter aestuarii]